MVKISRNTKSSTRRKSRKWLLLIPSFMLLAFLLYAFLFFSGRLTEETTALDEIFSSGQPPDDNAKDTKKAQGIVYPYPAPDGATPIMKPAFGAHRLHADAVFALAEGHDLQTFIPFVESLKSTEFTGDLVLGISAMDQLKPGVEQYLKSHDDDGINVVAYTATWICHDGQGKIVQGANSGIRPCKLVGMFADEKKGGVIKDPREARPVATARYDLYWCWSLNYSKHSWIMLIDSRDTYFQLHPFVTVQRESNPKRPDGLLYLFEENAEVSRIKDSSYNRRWLNGAYGKEKVKSFSNKAIICSGSTMGEQVAIESYLRGMVAQFDNTKCKMKGCDQGFHNYLWYSGELSKAQGVREVIVSEQGKGIINNLAVLRTKPLREWGILNEFNGTIEVLNWDKSVSAVAHQYDRDKEMNTFIKGVRKQLIKTYAAEMKNT